MCLCVYVYVFVRCCLLFAYSHWSGFTVLTGLVTHTSSSSHSLILICNAGLVSSPPYTPNIREILSTTSVTAPNAYLMDLSYQLLLTTIHEFMRKSALLLSVFTVVTSWNDFDALSIFGRCNVKPLLEPVAGYGICSSAQENIGQHCPRYTQRSIMSC